jgi:hypothetical protein
MTCAKVRYDNNKEAKIEYQTTYQQSYRSTIDGRVTIMWHLAKNRAKEKGLPFSITKQDIKDLLLSSEYCSITGDKLELTNQNKTANAYAPSIDQIVAGQGYTRENMQVVCWWYNAAKGNWFTDEEARKKFGKERSSGEA